MNASRPALPNRLWQALLRCLARPAQSFLILGSIFGLAYLFLVPPFLVSDESFHFWRAYQVSQGTFVAPENNGFGVGMLPAGILQVADRFAFLPFHYRARTSLAGIRAALKIPLQKDDRSPAQLTNTTPYSPVSYLGQAPLIAVGAALNLPALALLYLGRLGALVVAIALGYAALRLVPAAGAAFFLLLMMPMTLADAASLSADSLTDAIAILFVALAWRLAAKPAPLAQQTPRLKPSEIFLLGVTSILLTLSKLAYFPLLAMLALIPRQRFAHGRRLVIVGGIVALNAAALLCWGVQTGGLGHIQKGNRPRQANSLQLAYVRDHPLHFFGPTAWQTVRERGLDIGRAFVGELGWGEPPVPGWLAWPYLALLVLACWPARGDSPRPRTSPLLLLAGAVLMTVALMAVLQYVYWSPLHFRLIDGMQGRYFIPLAPAIVLLLWSIAANLPQRAWMASPRRQAIAASMAAVCVNLIALAMIYKRFFMPPPAR